MAKLKILFLLSEHRATDDRVCYHQKPALQTAGADVDVYVVSTHLSYLKRRKAAQQYILHYSPDVIICDSPQSVFYALQPKHSHNKRSYNKHSYNKRSYKLVFDITEWHPKKQDTHPWHRSSVRILCSFIKKRFDAYLYGETAKAAQFVNLTTDTRPSLYLPYYPSASLFNSHSAPISKPHSNQHSPSHSNHPLSTSIRLLYAGPLTEEKGAYRAIAVAKACALTYPEYHWHLDIISSDHANIISERNLTETNITDDNLTEDNLRQHNLSIQLLPSLPLNQFCQRLSAYHFCLDLRDNDPFNTQSLPIKYFYYMASGAIPVYTNLEAIKSAVPEYAEIGPLVAETDIPSIVAQIGNYITNKPLFTQTTARATQLFHEKYSWETLEQQFTQFIIALDN